MSMQDNGISEYAFLFTDETIKILAKKNIPWLFR